MWELRWRKKKHKKHINSILDVFPPIYNLMVQIHKIISICKLCISYNMFIQHQQKKKKRRKMFTTRYTHAFPLHHRQTTFILFFFGILFCLSMFFIFECFTAIGRTRTCELCLQTKWIKWKKNFSEMYVRFHILPIQMCCHWSRDLGVRFPQLLYLFCTTNERTIFINILKNC